MPEEAPFDASSLHTGPQYLLSAGEMRAAEEGWFAAGHNSFALMRTAATKVAAEAFSMLGPDARVVVLAGPGNNGGDAYVVAAILAEAGHAVDLVAAIPPTQLRGDAARAAALWQGEALPPKDINFADYTLVIDGLFGIGLTRSLAAELATLAKECNASGVPVLAIDIPSGVNADTGAVPGIALRAHTTVTFHTAKPGHYLYPGRRHCGRLVVADIGLPASRSALMINEPRAWGHLFPMPRAESHKYTRGGALVWSGPVLQTGAARLAACAALRIGAGAVTLAGQRDALMVHAAQVSAIMLAEADVEQLAVQLARPQITAACIGPGAGVDGIRPIVEVALRSGKSLVLDADALTGFAGAADELGRQIRRFQSEAVLTPHAGEFARLFPDLAGSKVEQARAAARVVGAVVVLKGADTVIASPGGWAMINHNAPPWLASAGSGDTLSGFITGLLAQGMPAFAAAAAAVWVHGAMGEALGIGLVADDLAGPEVRSILNGLTKAGEVSSAWL